MEKEITTLLRSAAERGLTSLVIGGNAVVLLGYIRTTVDLDLLVPEEMRSRWLDLTWGSNSFTGPRRSCSPENLVALKLHAAASPTRSKPEIDWEDIRQIVRIGRLRIADASFRALVLRYGGDDAVRRIEGFARD